MLFAGSAPADNHRDTDPGTAAPPTPLEWRPEDARLTDFGIAKRLDGDSTLTATDSVLGTPAYMAPEQARGASKFVGVGADVYSLGVILYEALTGRVPFVAANVAELLPQIQTAEPVPPSRLVAVLPGDLETICLKCLAKDVGRRYESAAALADDLERFLQNQPILARPVSRAEKLWRWCRRNPSVSTLLVLLVLVVVGGFAAVTHQWQEAVSARAATEREAKRATAESIAKVQEAAKALTAQERAEGESRKAVAALQKAEAHLTHSRVAQAQLLWEANDVQQMGAVLDACPPVRRGWEWYYLRGLRRSYLEAVPLPDWGHRVAVSPDGQPSPWPVGCPSGLTVSQPMSMSICKNAMLFRMALANPSVASSRSRNLGLRPTDGWRWSMDTVRCAWWHRKRSRNGGNNPSRPALMARG